MHEKRIKEMSAEYSKIESQEKRVNDDFESTRKRSEGS